MSKYLQPALRTAVIIMLFAILFVGANTARANETDNDDVSWLCDNLVGVVTGSTGEYVADELCSTDSIIYFSEKLNVYSAVLSNKIKYAITDEVYAIQLAEKNARIRIIPLVLDDKYENAKQVAIELNGSIDDKTFTFDAVTHSLYVTFVENNNWEFFAVGLRNTIEITVLSYLLAVVVGILLYFLSTRRQNIFKRFVKGYELFFTCIPDIIMLMAVYYIVFWNVNVQPYWAAVLAFGLIEGTAINEAFSSAVKVVGVEQIRAARAMGFSTRETFSFIVFPQSMRTAFPSLRSTFVNILKTTSIIGFISGFDLTHAVEAVRADTFDIILPLVFVGIIYFICIFLFIKLFNFCFDRTNPQRKSQRKALK
jgi:polar amino acid transport system substrate-binding protein